MQTVIECLDELDETPTAIIAYTVKGFGLPISGHRDNHGGLLNTAQVKEIQGTLGIAEGNEWDTPTDREIQSLISSAPYRGGKNGLEIAKSRRLSDDIIPVPALTYRPAAIMSTQEAFGRIMTEISRQKSEFADRIVTTSPDVASSTNLSGFINQRGVFGVTEREDVLKASKVLSTNKWNVNAAGQHMQLGIAENNLFLHLAALGLSSSLFGKRLLHN